ncbi:MAG: WD40 repeat domain-containing protein [Verrucomicrobia bacterium]|nr:WD40 repeat domain-containing protein [Verrucomicrobiota bacterium]
MSCKTSTITTSPQAPTQPLTPGPAPQSSGLVKLPTDLYFRILGMLPIQQIGCLNQTCREICINTTNNSLILLLSQHFPNVQKTDPNQTDLEALIEQYLINSNLTKGVYASHTLQGHDTVVSSLALDGQRLFSGSYDKAIKVWDLNTNTCTATLQGHDNAVMSLALDGQKLFSGSSDNTIKIWDLNTNTCTATLQGHDNAVMSLALDGQKLFSGSSDNTIKIWDLNTNTCTATLQGHMRTVSSLAQDGQRFFSGSYDKAIKVWDLNTNTCTATLQEQGGAVHSLALDGQRLFSASYLGTIKIWDLNTNTCIATLQMHNGRVPSFALDGQRLFSGTEKGSIKVWDFNVPDEAILREIAALLKSKDPVISEDAMARFTRMPPGAKKAIYDELRPIMTLSEKGDFGRAEHAFLNQNGQSSTPEQKAQAILNYLVKRS